MSKGFSETIHSEYMELKLSQSVCDRLFLSSQTSNTASQSILMSTWLTPLIQKQPKNQAGLLRLWDYFICCGHKQAPAFAATALVLDVFDEALSKGLHYHDAETYLEENLANIAKTVDLSVSKAQQVVMRAETLRQKYLSSGKLRETFNLSLRNKGLYGEETEKEKSPFVLEQEMLRSSVRVTPSVFGELTKRVSLVVGGWSQSEWARQEYLLRLFALLLILLFLYVVKVVWSSFIVREDEQYVNS